MSLHDPTNPNSSDTPKNDRSWFELAAAHTRARYTGDSEQASATERRIVEIASRRRRKPRALWLVPLALVGSGSLAWAEEVEHAVKWTVAQVRELVRAEPSVATTEPKTATTNRTNASGPKAAAHDAPAITPSDVSPNEATSTEAQASTSPAPEEQAPEQQAPEQQEPEPSVAAESTNVSPSMSRPRTNSVTSTVTRGQGALARNPSQSPSAPAPSDLDRYRKGYVAQFEGGDYVAALNAWDEYLRHVPGGRFTPEVRYNRALVLAHLGRKQEAIAALQPFAAGAYGPSRQQSAAKLIAELQAR